MGTIIHMLLFHKMEELSTEEYKSRVNQIHPTFIFKN